MGLGTYKGLTVWQKSIGLVDAVYMLTRKFPKEEVYGLVSQMRRAAVSIPSNIAEGYRRKSAGEYRQFLSVAFGSAAELETQLEITRRQYPKLDVRSCQALRDEVLRMLNVMLAKFR